MIWYRSKSNPSLMWFLALLFYAYRYILDVFPSVATQGLMQAFQVNATQLGILSSLYFYPYAVMQIPAGLILDRFGARKIMTFAALTAAGGALLFGISNFLLWASVGRFLIGLGVSSAFISALHVTSEWMPSKRFTFFSGFIFTVGMGGAISGQAPIAALIGKIGWRHTSFCFAFLGLILALLFWLFMQDKHKQQLPLPTEIKEESAKTFWPHLKKVLKNSQNWIISFYGAMTFMPTIVFASLWGVPFLISKFSYLTTTRAASLVSLIFLGWVFGAPIFGSIADKYKNYKFILYFATVGMLFSALGIIYLSTTNLITMSLFLFALGFFSGGSIIICSLIRDNNPIATVGAALGFMNMFDMVLGTLGQPLIGWFLDLGWSGKLLHDGTRLYTLGDFKQAFLIIPLCLAVAFLLLLGIKKEAKS